MSRCLAIKFNILDLSKIGAFRPIASLTSPYKLFSGVFAGRLDSVINKIVSKCQKAYSSKFVIQEGLITCYEIINKAIETNTSLGILNLDFAAAFDSVSHKKCLSSFKFWHIFFRFSKHYLKQTLWSCFN